MTKYWLGKKRSDETKKKISEKNKGRKQPKDLVERRAIGNRKHGKSRQSYNYREWRRQVLEKCGNKCFNCGSNEKRLHCHHKIPWKIDESLRFSLDNGIALCPKCHIRIGRESGEIDGTETQFKKGMTTWNKDKKGICKVWNKGIPLSIETKKKLSQSMKGKGQWNRGLVRSEETKKKISESKKGHIPWNKGIAQAEEVKEKLRMKNKGRRNSINTEFKKGQTPWNKKVK